MVRPAVVITGLGLAASAAFLGFTHNSGAAPTKSDKENSATGSNPFEQTNPQDADPIQEKALEPTDRIVAQKYLPHLYDEGEYADLPQPGTPQNEVDQFCKLRASAISSNRPDILQSLYQYGDEASLTNDMKMLDEYNQAKKDIIETYPATPEPLFAFECKDDKLIQMRNGQMAVIELPFQTTAISSTKRVKCTKRYLVVHT